MQKTRTTVLVAGFVAGVFASNRAFGQGRDIEAGPIWNQRNATQRCPQVCGANQATWNGQWRTTVAGHMSVCGCAAPTVAVAVVAPISAPACAWSDGQDPAFPGDPGRGVSEWAAHYGFVAGGGRAQVAAFISARFETLRACLSPADYARLYADVSTQLAYYGRLHAAWVDGPDARVNTDNGRGVASWQAHLDFAMAPSAAVAGRFVRQRFSDLNTTLTLEAYGRLYADVSILIARFARNR